MSGAAPSGVTPSSPALRANVNPSSVQALLLKQRQALEAEHALKLAGVKARFAEELTVTQDELADWKLSLPGCGQQHTGCYRRKGSDTQGVLQELEEERPWMPFRDEAAQAVERIRAAGRSRRMPKLRRTCTKLASTRPLRRQGANRQGGTNSGQPRDAQRSA